MEPSDGFEKARRLREGDGVERDPVAASDILRELADAGDPKAAASLGYMHLVGEGIPKDIRQAEHYLTIAADSGDTGAMCNLGVLKHETDPAAALSWYSRAAESGSVSAMRNAASLDPGNAVAWLQRAADLGDPDSICILAAKYRNGDGVELDKARAAELYRKAADLGDPGAQYDLAFMLDCGEGIPADPAEAERYFEMAADQGDTDACLCIGGILYERGDFPRAESYFLSAAMKDDVKAQYNLGLLYLGDHGAPPDMAKAREWFDAAAEQGFVLAHTMLGSLDLDSGDVAAAAEHFRFSAEAGEPTAQYNLGALGLSGQIEMPFEESAGWVSKSASNGFQPAMELLMRLNSQRISHLSNGTSPRPGRQCARRGPPPLCPRPPPWRRLYRWGCRLCTAHRIC